MEMCAIGVVAVCSTTTAQCDPTGNVVQSKNAVTVIKIGTGGGGAGGGGVEFWWG